jgi:hypothetical protein
LLRIELSIYSTSFNMNNVCLLKRFLIPILVFFLFLPDKGLTQNRIWTLEDCIYYAFENNLQIKQSALNVKNFEISKLEAKLSLIPNLNSDASFSYNWGRVLDRTNYTYTDKETNQANFGIHANMRLFGGLQLQNQIKKASLDFLTSQYDYDKIKDDITLLLTQAYLTVPIMLEYQTNPNSNRNSFHLSAGMIFGWKYRTYTKMMEKENGRNVVKNRETFHMSPFRYDLSGRIGWGVLNLYATYSLNTLFKKDEGPKLYPFAIGITITGW